MLSHRLLLIHCTLWGMLLDWLNWFVERVLTPLPWVQLVPTAVLYQLMKERWPSVPIWVSGLAIFTIGSIHNPLPVVCLSLPPLNNGIVSYNDSTLGLDTVANYTCGSGYTLEGGSTTRICLSNGTWSGFNPVCQRKWNYCLLQCVLISILR